MNTDFSDKLSEENSVIKDAFLTNKNQNDNLTQSSTEMASIIIKKRKNENQNPNVKIQNGPDNSNKGEISNIKITHEMEKENFDLKNNKNDKIRAADICVVNKLENHFSMTNFNQFLDLRERAYKEKNFRDNYCKSNMKIKKKNISNRNNLNSGDEPLFQFWYDCTVPFKGNLKVKQLWSNKDNLNKYDDNTNNYNQKMKAINELQLGNKFENHENLNTISSDHHNKSYDSSVIVQKVKLETQYEFFPFLTNYNENNSQSNNIWFDCTVPFKGNMYFRRKIKKIEENNNKQNFNNYLLENIRKNDEIETNLSRQNKCCLIY